MANDLSQYTVFADIKIAGLQESRGGATIAQVVEIVLPFPGNAEAAVMVEAIAIAAKQQTSGQVVGTMAVIGDLAALILWGLFGER